MSNKFSIPKTRAEKIIPLLKFPEKCILSNRSAMKEEEVFLRGLYELCSGENQEKISAHVFGREFSAQSRAFTYFIKHMYNNIEHLVKKQFGVVYQK
jgi:hypothetical protein